MADSEIRVVEEVVIRVGERDSMPMSSVALAKHMLPEYRGLGGTPVIMRRKVTTTIEMTEWERVI